MTGLINHCGKARTWEGTRGRKLRQHRALRFSVLSRLSGAALLCQRPLAIAMPSSGVRGTVRSRLHMKQVGVRLELLKSGWIETTEMVHQEHCRGR